MSNLPVIDLEAIENLRALNPDDNDEFVREIVGIFFEDTPQRLDELRQSLASGDVVKFTRAAHSIKGSSSNIGASALRSSAEHLEHHAKANGLSGVEPMIHEIESEFSRVQQHLRDLLKLQ